MSFSRLSGKLHRKVREGEAPAEPGGPSRLPSALAARQEPRRPGITKVYLVDDSAEPPIDPLGLGTLVHAILAEVDFREPKNLAALVERHAAEHVGDDRAAIAQATEMLERFLISPRRKRSPRRKKIYRELEFLLAWPPEGVGKDDGHGGRYFQGFIDLIYQDAAGGWHILDFKTNLILEETRTSVAANYEMQMLVYALAAEKISKPAAGTGTAFSPHRLGNPVPVG